DRLVALLDVLRGQLLVALEPRALLGDARAGGHPHPLELALEGLPARALLLPLEGEPGLLLLQPRRAIAPPGDAVAARELEDPAPRSLAGVLHLRLLVEELVELIGVGPFGEAVVDLVEAREQRADRGDGLLDIAEHGLGLFERGLLRQEPDRDPRRRPGAA